MINLPKKHLTGRRLIAYIEKKTGQKLTYSLAKTLWGSKPDWEFVATSMDALAPHMIRAFSPGGYVSPQEQLNRLWLEGEESE